MVTTSPRTTGAEAGGDAIAHLYEGVPAVGRGLPCRRDPDLWFAEKPTELERAKTLCADCPIKAECLAGALERAEPWGVWGGEIFERGMVVARKRPRGRPRKNPAVPGDESAVGAPASAACEEKVA
jgi:WhiB family transcriptional regulator, redox-sensing transcriptional regulator